MTTTTESLSPKWFVVVLNIDPIPFISRYTFMPEEEKFDQSCDNE